MFQNLSIGHLAVVMVIVLLLFGAKRIPEIGASLGGGIKAFKKSIDDVADSGSSNTIDAAPAQRVSSPPPHSAPTSVASSDQDGAPKRLLR